MAKHQDLSPTEALIASAIGEFPWEEWDMKSWQEFLDTDFGQRFAKALAQHISRTLGFGYYEYQTKP